MDQRVIDFLASKKVGVLATLLKDGTPHAAAVHFSENLNAFALYISTSNTSRKVEEIIDRGSVKASFVVGFSEEEWITLQMDGVVASVTDADELVQVHQIHYKKHPGSEKYKNDPETLFLKFVPTWWRFTDYNTYLETILSSEK